MGALESPGRETRLVAPVRTVGMAIFGTYFEGRGAPRWLSWLGIHLGS